MFHRSAARCLAVAVALFATSAPAFAEEPLTAKAPARPAASTGRHEVTAFISVSVTVVRSCEISSDAVLGTRGVRGACSDATPYRIVRSAAAAEASPRVDASANGGLVEVLF